MNGRNYGRRSWKQLRKQLAKGHAPVPCPKPAKFCYATNEVAQTAAKAIAGVESFDMSPYQCACGWWHLATVRRRKAA